MSKRLTTKEWVKRAKEKWGDLYDYSLVKYKNGRSKVLVICKIDDHGAFPVTPENHLHKGKGRGCPKCKFLNLQRDISGQKFGKLKVLRKATPSEKKTKDTKSRELWWWVQCTCGRNPFITRLSSLTRSEKGIWACRVCSRRKMESDKKQKILERILHKKFRLLTVLRDWGSDKDKQTLVICRCECGNTAIVVASALWRGGVTSCGCNKGFEDNYNTFRNSKSFANEDCYFYIADIDEEYRKPGITSNLVARKKIAEYRQYEFTSSLITRAAAWTIEQYILAETKEAFPKRLPRRFINLGGKSEIRMKEKFSIKFYENRFKKLLKEISSTNWEEVYLEKFNTNGKIK